MTTHMEHARSAPNSADATRSSGLGKSTKSQDQQCPSCSRSQTLVMPKRPADRRSAVYRSALGMSGVGLLLGLLTVQAFPMAGCLAVVTATAGLLYSSVEFLPLANRNPSPLRRLPNSRGAGGRSES